jgi:Spy/CpxP family protein refolding chaperone
MKSIVRPVLACAVIGLAVVPPGLATAAPGPGKDTAPASSPSPHGFVQMIGEAIAEVDLRPDQEAQVEDLSKEIEPLQARVDEAESALLLALATQVEAGQIGEDALAPEISGYVAARQVVSPEIRRIVEDLHGILDPEQRADFSEALACAVHDVARAILSGERFDELAKKLGLDGEQIVRLEQGITTLRAQLAAERALLHRLTEAFRDADFSIERIVPQSEVPEMSRKRAERIVELTASLAEVLYPSQRIALAERLREAARTRMEGSEAGSAEVLAQGERIAATADLLWAGARVRRGAFGGVRGRVVVGGSAGFAYRRVVAYPYAAAWGYGW